MELGSVVLVPFHSFVSFSFPEGNSVTIPQMRKKIAAYVVWWYQNNYTPFAVYWQIQRNCITLKGRGGDGGWFAVITSILYLFPL